MKYFEKAVENYAKEREDFYARALKEDIAEFNKRIERMVADGECHGGECKYCPVRLASDAGVKVRGCGVSTPQETMEVIAMEVAENDYIGMRITCDTKDTLPNYAIGEY